MATIILLAIALSPAALVIFAAERLTHRHNAATRRRNART